MLGVNNLVGIVFFMKMLQKIEKIEDGRERVYEGYKESRRFHIYRNFEIIVENLMSNYSYLDTFIVSY